MIDTHCHLSIKDYENLDDLILELSGKGISCIVNGCDIDSNEEALGLSKKYSNIYCAIGFHPEDVDIIPDNYIQYIEQNISNIVAIGEIGLDYHWRKDNKDKQLEIFSKQLEIAEKYNIPVIVHSRDAINETYEVLKKYKVRGSIHAFSGSLEMARKFIDLGFKLGIGGVVTFKNCNLKEVLKEIELKDIVLETDSPYMSPEPVRGRKNTPLNLKYIVEFISNLKEISYEKVCEETNNNAVHLFDL